MMKLAAELIARSSNVTASFNVIDDEGNVKELVLRSVDRYLLEVLTQRGFDLEETPEGVIVSWSED